MKTITKPPIKKLPRGDSNDCNHRNMPVAKMHTVGFGTDQGYIPVESADGLAIMATLGVNAMQAGSYTVIDSFRCTGFFPDMCSNPNCCIGTITVYEDGNGYCDTCPLSVKKAKPAPWPKMQFSAAEKDNLKLGGTSITYRKPC